jgi:hypothetical protein
LSAILNDALLPSITRHQPSILVVDGTRLGVR